MENVCFSFLSALFVVMVWCLFSYRYQNNKINKMEKYFNSHLINMALTIEKIKSVIYERD